MPPLAMWLRFIATAFVQDLDHAASVHCNRADSPSASSLDRQCRRERRHSARVCWVKAVVHDGHSPLYDAFPVNQ